MATMKTGMMMRGAWLLMAVALLSACSSGGGDTSDPDAAAKEAVRQQKDCADPQWKEAHLGVWYSVCRPNAAVR
jgi:hypothetical protein